MIQDDAGRPVRRFAPSHQANPFRRGKSNDPGVRELADRLNEHVGSSYPGLARLVAIAIGGALLIGALAAGAYTIALSALRGPRGLTRWGDYAIYVGFVSGLVGIFIILLVREIRRDRANTPTITRSLREEGRCLSCASLIEAPADADALHPCQTCNARWNHAATPAQLQSEPPSDEMPTIADVTGRVFRVVDIQKVRERPEIERLVGVIQDKARVGRSAWFGYLILIDLIMLAMFTKWIFAAHGIWRWVLIIFMLWNAICAFIALRHSARHPPKLLSDVPTPGTLLRHEYCPACLATLRLGSDPRETRHCPGCNAIWPGASEMPAHGYPAMTPGTCQVCHYDVSRCAANPERLVTCPECGSQSRLAKVPSTPSPRAIEAGL